MAGSLVRTITAAALATYGVNFLDIAPPSTTTGVSTKQIGIVADLPWGPTNTVTLCGSAADFFNTFCPAPFDAAGDYVALRAFLNKKFPGPIQVCRIEADSAVARTDSYTVSGGAIVWTANYKGAVASAITVTFAAASDGVSTSRDITIAIGTGYSVTYTNVTLSSITSLGNDYITFTKTSSPSVLPAAAATASSTTAGADGTATAANYVGTSSSNVGIRKFYASNLSVDVLFVAECPSALINAVNAGLVAYADDAGKPGMAVLCSVPSQTATAAISYVPTYTQSESKVVYCWPRVVTTDTNDPAMADVTVDGNAFMAVAMATVNPWVSPEGKPSTVALGAISALETDDSPDATYEALNAAGISTFFIEQTLGAMVRGAYTTNTTSGQTDIVRSAYRSYLTKTLATYAINYVGVPLDVDLTNQRLGENTSGLRDAIVGFLAAEQQKGRINGYTVDPYGANTSGDIDAGTWTIAVAVDTFAPTRVMIIRTTVGSTVVTTS